MRKQELRNKAITVLELTKGYTPSQRDKMGNLLSTMEELAGDILELTNETEKKEEIHNQDIIDFRYFLIETMIADFYMFRVVCNDGTNDWTPDKRKVLNDVLVSFNQHFMLRGYNIG